MKLLKTILLAVAIGVIPIQANADYTLQEKIMLCGRIADSAVTANRLRKIEGEVGIEVPKNQVKGIMHSSFRYEPNSVNNFINVIFDKIYEQKLGRDEQTIRATVAAMCYTHF